MRSKAELLPLPRYKPRPSSLAGPQNTPGPPLPPSIPNQNHLFLMPNTESDGQLLPWHKFKFELLLLPPSCPPYGSGLFLVFLLPSIWIRTTSASVHSPTPKYRSVPPLPLNPTPRDIQNTYGVKAHSRTSCWHCSYDTSQYQSHSGA